MKLPSIKKPQIKINKKLRQLIFYVVVISVVLCLAGVAVQRYNREEATKRQAQEQAAKQEEAKRAETEAKHARVLAQYEQTRLECEKLKGANSATPAFVQRSYRLPTQVNCGPAIIE